MKYIWFTVCSLLIINDLQAQLSNSFDISPPRFNQKDVNIDGFLDEVEWSKSVSHSGFTSYLPVDGRPTEDDTEVRIWYSPTALYVGLIAHEIHNEVRSTLADRDNLENDDRLTLILDTYDDKRSAFAFTVNPLGQQRDGTITDNTSMGRNSKPFRYDDNPDYVFNSKGRLTEDGFIVEIEIPFKSLRYQSKNTQNWGFNVLRYIQHSGYTSTLFSTKIGVASFLGQSGKLVNFSGIERDRIFDINPELRGAVSRTADDKKFNSEMTDPLGFNVRYGWSSNVGINATVNPDFSQIEADVAQINYDPRRSLFFPEKRPFFLDGIERFQTPTRLIYTRRIANPVAAGKIAGKFGANTIGYISAADNSGPSISEMDLSYVNVLRLKRDLSDQNHMGLVFTDKTHTDRSNKVFAIDGRFVEKDTYTFRAQGGFSQTNDKEETGTIAPMWDVAASANGRKWSGSFSFKGYHNEFNPEVGFIERGNYVTVSTGPTRRFYGKKDAIVEQLIYLYV